MQKGAVTAMAKTTDEHIVKMMKLLILMKLDRQEIFEIAAAMETTEMLNYFLNILSEKNYDMTPEEVYGASVETALTFQTAK